MVLMIYPYLVLTCALLASLWRWSVLGGCDDLPLHCPPHALPWPLSGGGQYGEVLMIYPYLVLHMRSLGLSAEEVSTGRF